MRIFFTTLIIVLFQLPLFAADHHSREQHGVVLGEIRSSESGEPIQFATISVAADSRFACISDENGRFKLRATAGTQNIIVSCLGYDSYKLSIVVVGHSATSP